MGRLISQTEDDDARRLATRHGENVAEIQIECETVKRNSRVAQ